MEDDSHSQILVSKSWTERLENGRYQNWLKVGYALYITCKGIQPYVEREAKAFHASMTTMLHTATPCTCTHVPRRRPNPHHDMNLCDWAMELERHHRPGGKPTWSYDHSDGSKWTDPVCGYWEVAKLYMPFGCAKGKVGAAQTDATGLLNLLLRCDHYNINTIIVEKVKGIRNTWAHAANQELDADETGDAFLVMKDLLLDAEFQTDGDAKDALKTITALETNMLVDFKAIDNTVVFIVSIKEELSEKLDFVLEQESVYTSEIKDMLQYCMNADEERDHILRDIQQNIDWLTINFKNADKISRQRRKMLHNFGYSCLEMLMIIIKMLLVVPGSLTCRVRLVFVLLLSVAVLEENIDSGCTRDSSDDPLQLKQFDFTEYLNRAREGFVGRQWLFRNITDSFNKSQEKSHGLMIVAAPGFGKSALISNLICSKFSSSSIHNQILGYHLCIHSSKNTQIGDKFVRNLAAMIASKLKDYKEFVLNHKYIQEILNNECLSDPAECLEIGILTPLRDMQLRFEKPMIIIIDALDECLNKNNFDE